jgi:glucosamine--fructose-6-phosphate aminotransferase (isomerizing)
MSQLDDFITQIRSLPAMIGPCVEALEPSTRKVLSTPEIYGVRQIILTGSGDSFFAGAAAAPVFRDLTGLPVQAMTSMEASRYAGQTGKSVINARGTLVISVSYSGEAARLVVAAHRWRDRGALTLGLTAASEGRLAKAAERVVNTKIEELAPAPGTRTYVVSLIALNLLAIRLGEVLMRITMDEANALRREIGDIGKELDDLERELSAPIEAFVEQSRDWNAFDTLGSGPSLGSAGYSAAKLVEAAGIHAIAQDSEEFFHLNFFVARPSATPAILYAPSKGIAASRSRELVETLGQLGRPTLVVTDQAGFGGGRTELLVPHVREWFAPIIHTIPGALLAAHAAAVRGEAHYRGHTGPWIGARGAGLVRHSHIDFNRG